MFFKKNIKELKKRVRLIMPPFRIHQTRSRPERILIRLMQGRYIIPSAQSIPSAQPNPVAPVTSVTSVTSVVPEEKKKTTISLKQIRDIILLLQKSEHKNLDKLLPPELKSL